MEVVVEVLELVNEDSSRGVETMGVASVAIERCGFEEDEKRPLGERLSDVMV